MKNFTLKNSTKTIAENCILDSFATLVPKKNNFSFVASCKLLFFFLVMAVSNSYAQSYREWTSTGTDWNTSSNWNPSGITYGQLEWKGNGNATSNNNVSNPYSSWRFYFSGSKAYTLTGNKVELYDFGGQFSWILSDATANQILNLPIDFNDSGTRYSFITNRSTGTLTFGSGFNVGINGSNIIALRIAGTNAALPAITFNGTISGSRPIDIGKDDSGADQTNTRVFFNGNNSSYSGVTTLYAGTLSIPANTALGSGSLTMGNGTVTNTLAVTDTTTRTQGIVINNTSTAGVIDVASGKTFTMSGVLSGGATNTTKIGKSGPGTLTLSGTATYNGQLQIGDGTVIANNNTAISTNTTTANRGVDLGLNVGDTSQPNNVSLLANNGFTVGNSIYVAPNTSSATRTIGLNGSGSATFDKEIYLDGNLTITGGSGTTTISGAIVNTGGVIANTGTVVLSAANTYTGTTTVNTATTLRLGASSSTSASGPLGTPAAGTTVNSGGVLDMNGFTLSATATEALTLNGTGISSGGALVNNSGTASSWSTSGSVALASDSSIGGSGYLTLPCVVSGAFNLNKVGTGTLFMSGSNTFGGTGKTLTIENGTVSSEGASLGSTSNAIVLGAASTSGNYTYTGTGATLANVYSTAAGGGSITNASTSAALIFSSNASLAGTLTLNCSNTTALTLSGVLSGTSGVTVNSASSGVATLSGANTYTGTTIVNAGTLTLGAANALPITASAGDIRFTGGTPTLNLGQFNLGTSTATANSAGLLDFDVNTTVNLGAANGSAYSYYFKDSSGQTWDATTITIGNWVGTAGATAGTGAGARRIFIGSSASLTTAQLNKIAFTGYGTGATQLSTGEIVPRGPFFTITGSSLAHGTRCVGTAATTITYTITNTGANASGVTVTSNNSEFVVSNLSSTTINNGATATYDVTFTPSASGARTADITINTTTPNGNTPVTSTVTGTGNALPQGSLTANGPFCATGAGQLTWTASAGTGNYTVVYNDGTANRTASSVVSGTAFNTFTTPVTSTTTYTLVSVTDANTCARTTGFTGSSATITVNTSTTSIAPGTTQNIPVSTNGTVLTVSEGTSTFTSRVWKYGTSSGTYPTSTGVTATTYTPNFGSTGTYYVVCETTYGSPCSTTVTSNEVQINVTSNTITTGTVTGSPFCAGATGVSVPFTYSAPASFPTGGSCVFKAQLSDASGSFASATDLQTVVSDASGSQSISVTIPSGAGNGSGYRIRVVSNSPAVDGTDNGTNLTISATPTTATNGSAQTICTTGTATLSGNSPSVGTGSWSVVSGPSTSSAQFASTSVFNTVFTPAGGAGSYVVRWTISNSPCTASTADATITVNAPPTSATNGSAQTICATDTATLSGNSPSVGTGSWSVVSGPSTSSAQFASTSVFNTVFTPAGGAGSYVVRWTISNSPCADSTADATITVNAVPTTATNGSTQTICTTGTATLSGNSPSVGTGAWTVVSGPSTSSAQFASTSVFNTVFTPAGGAGSYVVRWTISNSPCTASTADATITVNAPPTSATNGSAQTICATDTATLSGNSPSVGTGAWTVVSGPSTSSAQFASTSVFNTVFTPAGGAGSYVVRWTISNSPCTASTADATITVNAAPTTATNGSTQTICTSGTATLSGNSPSVGTGSWSVVSGPSTSSAQFASTSVFNTVFTPAGGAGSYVVRWTISNSPCTASTADATITVTTSVGGTATATSSSVCLGDSTSISLSGHSGTIQWQRSENGGSSWTSISGATSSTYTTSSLNVATSYRAVVTNGSCASANSTTAAVTISEANQSNAGNAIYNTTWSNGQNDSTTGFGAWTLSATGGAGFFSSGSSDVNNANTRSWGMYAGGTGGGNVASATRTVSMGIGNKIAFSMDNGSITSGNTIGFGLQNASGQNLMELYFVGGASFYTLSDNAGANATTVGYTSGGLDVTVSYTAANTYSVTITGKGASTVTYTGRTFSTQGGGQVPAQIRFFNSGAGSGSSFDLFFNSLSINNPVITTQPTASQTICTGTSTSLSVTANGTISGYQWEESANGTSGWASVSGGSGATTASYTTASLTSTTYYRVAVTGSCGTVYSSVSTVTVGAASVGGTATATASTLCTGTSTTITVSGHTGTIQWQQSADGSTGWANVTGGSGATTTTYTTPNLTATTYYRAVVTNGSCSSANSTTASVTITALPTTATNGSTQTICSTGTATLSGNTPSVGTGAWTVVSGPSTSSSQFSSISDPTAVFTPASGAGSYLIRWTISNSPCTASSADATITVSATNTWTGVTSKDWNIASNWSCNTVPNSSTDAVIVSATNSPEIGFSGTTAANCRNLTITSGTLTMSNASSLTLASTSIFSNSGAFIAGDGTVNFLGSGTITGTVAFNNINLSGLVSFSNAVTVNNRLRIATGGAVTTNSPTYGSGSLLQYFVGASYNRSLEWTTATSGAGYPVNVQVSTNGTNTTLNMLTTSAQCSGNLTIDSGNTLNTTSSTLTVIGNVLIDGTMSLAGDVYTRGNWTVGSAGTQTNNAKAVFFTAATGDQTVTKTGGGTVFFDYLIIDKSTSGNLVIESATNITLNTATGRVLQLNNVGGLDLNGRSLTLDNSGGSIYVNGARSIISSPSSPNGTIEVNQYKVIENNSGTGTLNLGATVTVNLNTNGNLDFGFSGGSAITTVNGILSINSNTSCFVNTNPPIYSSTSTLIYNSGGTRNRDLEWNATSGAGYPNDVIIQNQTTLEVANGSDTYRKIAGDLTILGAATSATIGCTNCSKLRITDLYTASPAVVSGTTGIGVEIGGDIFNKGRIELKGDTNARLKCTNFYNGDTSTEGKKSITVLSGDLNATPPFNGNYGGDLEITSDFQDDAVFTSNQRAVFFTGSGVQEVRGSATGILNIDYVVVAKSGSTNPVLLSKELLIGGPQGGSAVVFYAATDIIDLNGFKLTIGTTGVYNTVIGDGKFKGGSNDSELSILGIGEIGTLNFDNTTPGVTNNLKYLTLNRTISSPTYPTAGFTLGSDVAVSNTATLTAGTINLGSANMTIGASASIAVSSPDTTKMIIASGTGELRKTFTAAGSFIYPIGDNVGTAEYSPATLTFSGTPSGYAGVRVQNAKHPNINVGISDYITRYWPVTSTISSPTCTASFTYLAADENGTPSNYFGGRYLSPDWYCLEDVDQVSRIISKTGLSAFGDFTVYNPPAMTSTLTSSAATICANTSTNLQVAIGGGDSPYTVGPFTVVYYDSVLAANVTVNSYTSGANILVSPTASTTYTLQSVTSSKACYSTASDTKTVTIGGTSTYASGSWTPSAPLSTSTAIIDGGTYSAAADINACTLEVKNNAVVTIPSTYKVTLSGALTVETGSSFTLENDTNLVQTGGTTNPNTGSIRVKRNSSSLYLLDYTLWSSSVANQNLYGFSPDTAANRFYIYDEPTDQYNSLSSNNSFTVGRGYLIRVPRTFSATTPAIFTGIFTGKPNSGDITYSMSKSLNGFNAVGNPYPSQINVHNFIDSNISNIQGTLYFWRKRNNPLATSYATLTKLAYAANAAAGGDTGSTYYNTMTTPAADWVINAGQGFFVQAKSASNLVFTNTMRRGTNNGNQFFRTSSKLVEEPNTFKLNLTSTNGVFSQMVLGYSPEYTLGVDDGIDGFNINSTNYLCSTIEGAAYVIQGRPEFSVTDVVPLEYKIENADQYSITIEQLSGVFASQDVFLKDKLTNTIHDLKSGPYDFSSESGNFKERFEVVYESPLAVNQNTFNENNVVVYKQNQELVVNTGKIPMSNVKVYDIRGRLLISKDRIDATQIKLFTGSTQEVLLVKITSDSYGTVTKKVVN